MADLLEPGASFGAYRIVRLLGRGRDGATYLATTRSGANVVLRLFPRLGAPETARALLAEQEQIARFEHPFVARVLDAGVRGEDFYVVREWVEGISLPVRRSPLAPFLLAASAVEDAHGEGIVHGDLRPANILAIGDRGEIRVVDFGALTSTNPASRRFYAAPEAEEGMTPTAAGDVYSLARMIEAAPTSWPTRRLVLEHALSPRTEERPAMWQLVRWLLRAAGIDEPLVSSMDADMLLHAERAFLEFPQRPEPDRRPVVNSGFERPHARGRRLARTTLLRPNTEYELTLDVGPKDPRSIEETPVSLPAELEAGTRLTVTVHPVAGDVEIAEGVRAGTLVLRPDGTAAALLADDVRVADDRLRFPLRTGAAGEIRLRASILSGTTLIQSRLVTAQVGEPREVPGRRVRQRTVLDYALATRLTPAAIAPLADAADVSLMLNGDAGTHALQIVARDGTGGPIVTNGATFDAVELQQVVDYARKGLRRICWGTEDAWRRSEAYRYDKPAALDERLHPDLCFLAIRGYRLYDTCFNDLTGTRGVAADRLADRLRRPLRIQLASRRGASLLLPIALIYDAPLETEPEAGQELTMCDAYRSPSVAESPCFQGQCPHYDDVTVVCPSGFWGFRHAIGLPLSLRTGEDASEAAATSITYNNGPTVAMAVSTDPDFTLRPVHEARMKAMVMPDRWRYADTRARTYDLLKAIDNQLFYFYCHGGDVDGTPYLQVGPKSAPPITSARFRRNDIRWKEPSRPLVFINGCQTTAVAPEQLFDFVSTLVENASAAGVVGTEITTFEPLAGAFALACLRRFLRDGATLGEAIRGARLDLLQDGNPLGLIYTPFAMPSLRLVPAP